MTSECHGDVCITCSDAAVQVRVLRLLPGVLVSQGLESGQGRLLLSGVAQRAVCLGQREEGRLVLRVQRCRALQVWQGGIGLAEREQGPAKPNARLLKLRIVFQAGFKVPARILEPAQLSQQLSNLV